MYELTNEQRKCFGLPPVLEHWKRIELKPSPYDTFVTYAFLDGNHIVKVIQVSDLPDQCMYREYGMDQMLSESGKQILPKTEKGKPQKFTSAVLVKKTPVGIGLLFYRDHVDIFNFTTFDIISSEIKSAWACLGEISGVVSDEAILDKIFSKFCLGK